MTIVIVSILLLGCLLIATENITKVNRAAVAIFAGTAGWVLYICFGLDFVTSQHACDFSSYLHSQTPAIPGSSVTVKNFPSLCGKSGGDSPFLVGDDDDCRDSQQ